MNRHGGRREAVLYLACGFASMGISWACMFEANALFFGNTRYPGPWQNFILSMCNWTSGMLAAYAMNRKLVFLSDGPVLPELAKHVASRLSTLGVDIALRQALPLLGMDIFAVTLASAVVVTVLNYITGKFLVFRKKKGAAAYDGREDKQGV